MHTRRGNNKKSFLRPPPTLLSLGNRERDPSPFSFALGLVFPSSLPRTARTGRARRSNQRPRSRPLGAGRCAAAIPRAAAAAIPHDEVSTGAPFSLVRFSCRNWVRCAAVYYHRGVGRRGRGGGTLGLGDEAALRRAALSRSLVGGGRPAGVGIRESRRDVSCPILLSPGCRRALFPSLQFSLVLIFCPDMADLEREELIGALGPLCFPFYFVWSVSGVYSD
jgi:hypothetical protein